MLEIERLNAERELKSVFDGRLFHIFTTRSQKKSSTDASAVSFK